LSKFLKLVKNEFIKMFKTKSAVVPFLILALLLIGIPVGGKIFSDTESVKESDWKTTLVEQNKQYEQELQMTKEQIMAIPLEKDPMKKDLRVESYQANEYHLEHGISTDTGALGHMLGALTFSSYVITLIVLVYASTIVAREYAFGTIKFLLIRSVSRFQILMSKLVVVLLATAIFYIFAAILGYIVGGFFEGFAAETYRTVEVVDGKIVESSLIADLFRTIGFKIIELLPYVALAFLISTVMKSVGASIGVTMFLNFVVGGLIIGFLKKYEWSKYILFTHGDLESVYAGMPVVEGMTVGFSITMLLLYAVVFYVVTFVTFLKRDI
jgi:ABC-2 type transport system permease protein